MCNERVELSAYLIILVSPPGHPDSNFPGHVSNTITPNKLIKFLMHSNILEKGYGG